MTTATETPARNVPLDVVDTPPPAPPWGKASHILLAFVIAGLLVWIASGITTVAADEVMIVERMGQYVASDTGEIIPSGPGTHWLLPWPIDIPHKVRVNQSIQLVVDDFYLTTGQYDETKKEYLQQGIPREVLDSIFDPYLITSDKNVVNVKITVQYQVRDPVAFLQAVSHSDEGAENDAAQRESAIRQMASHVLIKEIARTPIDATLFEQRQKVMDRLAAEMNIEAGNVPADAAAAAGRQRQDLGIVIENVTMEAIWPARVDAEFKAAAAARFGSEARVKQANSEKESILTRARVGETSRILSDANAYAAKVVSDVNGEMDRFRAVRQRYEEAPELTRTALYADAVQTILDTVQRKLFVKPGQRTVIPLDPPDDNIHNNTPGR